MKIGCFLDRKGITLFAVLMLVIFASFAVLGVTTFIIQMLSRSSFIRTQTQCIYLAQAGIHNAIYFFRFHGLTGNGYFTLGQTNIDSNNFFVVGADAGGLLIVDASNARLGNGRADLLGLTIQNATNSQAITIDRMIVTFSGGRRLNQIRINGSIVFNRSGGVRSPANADIANYTLKPSARYNINFLHFNGNMAGSTISIQFVMTDGSTKTVAVYPASTSSNVVTMKSAGKTARSNIYRTIQADYNPLTGAITGYKEI